ncbi:MAG: hypothetical protein ACK5HL_02380 [Bacilli bacterium]
MKQVISLKKDLILKTKVHEIVSISFDTEIVKKEENYIEGIFRTSGTYKMLETSVNKEEFNEKIPYEIMLDDEYDLDSIDAEIENFNYEIINNEILRVNIELKVVAIKKEEDIFKEVETILEDDLFEKQSDRGFEVNGNVEFSYDDDKDEEITTIEKNDSLDEKEKLKNNDIDPIISIPEVVEEIQKRDIDPIISTPKVIEKIQKHDIDPIISKPEPIEEIKKNDITSQIGSQSINSLFNNLNDQDDKFVSYYVHILTPEQTIEDVIKKYDVIRDELEQYNNLEDIKTQNKIIIPAKINA